MKNQLSKTNQIKFYRKKQQQQKLNKSINSLNRLIYYIYWTLDSKHI